MGIKKPICIALFCLSLAVVSNQDASARVGYFEQFCSACHVDDTPSCNGCHHHGLPRLATTNKTEYNPGESMSVVMGGPAGSGWARAKLYDHNGLELGRFTGPTGMGDDGSGSRDLEYPYNFFVTAPSVPGTYKWEVAWYGSPFDIGNFNAFPHVDSRLETNEFTVLGTPPAFGKAADIEIDAISARERDTLSTDSLDMKSTGLEVVGVNKEVYLKPTALSDYASSITGMTWSVRAEPSPGAAVVQISDMEMFKFRPSMPGQYIIELTPQVNGVNASPSFQPIVAAKFVGTGTVGANAPGFPNCGVAFCHGDAAAPRLAKISEWNETRHAHKLENHMNGEFGGHYSVSCLECHTVGYDEVSMGNDNFHEVAQQISYDLNEIPHLVEDAATNNVDHFGDLPAPLQLKANIQCEDCHGPGSLHNGDPSRISGEHYTAAACEQCHDSISGYQQKFYQFQASGHLVANQAAGGHVQDRASCQICHVGEGFVFLRVEGEPAIPNDVTTLSGVNCVACHEVHGSDNEHILRKVSPVKLPDRTEFEGGLGNLCANCHNSRIENPTETINTSFRGAHHGPQADILSGTGAYDWGHAYQEGAAVHKRVVEDTCVGCHMADAPSGAFAIPVGSHTFEIVDHDTGENNVPNACGQCHPGLTTPDKVPLVPADYDGDGQAVGVQTEIRGLMFHLQTEILARMPGTEPGEVGIGISEDDWGLLPFNQRAVLYNYNLLAEDKSVGVHNSRYYVEILQRSYLYLTGRAYNRDFPMAVMLDSTSAVSPSHWRAYR
jgi:hypothetical protein